MQIYPSPLTLSAMNVPSVGFQSVRVYAGRVYYTVQHPYIKQVGVYSRDIHAQQQAQNEMPDTAYSVGTAINVYGGECLCVCPYGIVFADSTRNMLIAVKHGIYTPLVGDGAYYYADVVYNAYDNSLTYVCEHIQTHRQHIERYGFDTQATTTVAEGADFYHCPTVWRHHTAWLEWHKQHMPWDNSRIVQDGTVISSGCGHFQPHFAAAGDLYYVKDTGAYHHIFCRGMDITAAVPMDFYMPLWVYGMRTFTVLGDTVVAVGTKDGIWRMGTVGDGQFTPFAIDTPPSAFLSLYRDNTDNTDGTDGTIAYIAQYPNAPDAVHTLQVISGHGHCIHTADALPLPAAYISAPHPICFANRDGDTVHGFYYPPKNPQMPADTLPPLLVKAHGGPTGQTTTSYNAKIQFWTSRGFAVFDVNYSGSTGYGSAYRNRLNGRWGVLDVADIADGVGYCIDNRLCHPEQICISGSSAGGYAVLCALSAYPHIFTAGCSLYGIGNLHSLVAETHKFESRYMDVLIAPYDSHKHIYDTRSPIQHVERFRTPILLLQGTEDKVVAQNQAQHIYSTLLQQQVPTALILYQGEGHGFKHPAAKAHALHAELQFYQYIYNGIFPDYDLNAITSMQFT